jgi:hypothetical protein
MLELLNRIRKLFTLEVSMPDLNHDLRRFVLVLPVMLDLQGKSLLNTGARILEHPRLLLSSCQKYVLIPELILRVLLQKLIIDGTKVHEDGVVVVAEMGTEQCDVKANFADQLVAK